MNECELARGLRVELEEARRKIDVYREEGDDVRRLLLAACKERNALREELARRDAEKPVTALSWIEKTDARLEKIEARHDSLNSRIDDEAQRFNHSGMEHEIRLNAIDSHIADIDRRRSNGAHWVEKTSSRINAIESRLDGSNGLEFKVGAMDAKFMGCVEGLGKRIDDLRSFILKLEARVSKKRVRK